MNEPKLAMLEEHRAAWQTWLPRIAVAVVFLFVGKAKFGAQSGWVGIFDQLGLGQWFRYLTGALQVGGALLVLIPRTFPIGILILACTMLGAMAAWIFRLGAPFNALIPAAILGGLLITGGQELRTLLQRRNKPPKAA
jgi:putative oxidoreductase